MAQNPIFTAGASVTGVIIFVKAFIALAKAMQWFSLTEEKWSALSVFFETVIPIIAVWIGAWWVSRRTTNLADPRDKDGTELTRPNDVPVIEKMEKIQEEAIKIDKEITRGLT